MKAYLHIKNDGYFCHPRVSATISIDGVPQIGSVFHMEEAVQTILEEAIVEYYKRHPVREGCVGDYGELQSGQCCINEYIYVYDTLWKADDDGVYRLHIELDTNRPK